MIHTSESSNFSEGTHFPRVFKATQGSLLNIGSSTSWHLYTLRYFHKFWKIFMSAKWCRAISSIYPAAVTCHVGLWAGSAPDQRSSTHRWVQTAGKAAQYLSFKFFAINKQ